LPALPYCYPKQSSFCRSLLNKLEIWAKLKVNPPEAVSPIEKENSGGEG